MSNEMSATEILCRYLRELGEGKAASPDYYACNEALGDLVTSPIEQDFYRAWIATACDWSRWGSRLSPYPFWYKAYVRTWHQSVRVLKFDLANIGWWKSILQHDTSLLDLFVPEGQCLDLVYAQVPVDRFRADFIITRTVRFPDAKQLYHAGPFAVECDGAQWHDAARDRQRDIEFLRLRIPTIRFTGSQLYNDPFECMRHCSWVLGREIRSGGRCRTTIADIDPSRATTDTLEDWSRPWKPEWLPDNADLPSESDESYYQQLERECYFESEREAQ